MQVLESAVLVAACALSFRFNAALAGVAAFCASQFRTVFRLLEQRPVEDALVACVQAVASGTCEVFKTVRVSFGTGHALLIVINITVVQTVIARSVARNAFLGIRAIGGVAVIALGLADSFLSGQGH